VSVKIGDARAVAARDGEREGRVVKRLPGVAARKYAARTLVARPTQRIGGRESTLGNG
jgi:formylglycine-generating enzyme required for sulfatase activity